MMELEQEKVQGVEHFSCRSNDLNNGNWALLNQGMEVDY